MSNSVSSFEIEDVLSSIRRLVSAGERESKHGSGTGDKNLDRLVLSPSLRIDDDDAAGLEGLADQSPNVAYAGDSDNSENADTSTPSDEATEVGDTHSEPDEAQDEAAFFHHEKLSDADTDQTESGSSDDESSEVDEWEALTFIHSKSHEQRAAQSGSKSADSTGQHERGPVTFEEKIAEVEAAVATQAGQWEADEPTDDDFFGDAVSPIAWKESGDVAAAGVGSVPTTEAEQVVSASSRDEWSADGAVLDEDAVRELIGEIVRQELQGALGARITRNIRKLVRSEIHRALLTQKFD